ncbi:MAG TPA: DUF3144 domain-containing protein [Dokdonella sp.]
MDPQQDITEEQYFEIVDQFINQANEYSKRFPHGRISGALLFAAARYNAFNWVNRSLLREQSLEEAVRLFRTEYENMFRHNVQTMMPPKA